MKFENHYYFFAVFNDLAVVRVVAEVVHIFPEISYSKTTDCGENPVVTPPITKAFVSSSLTMQCPANATGISGPKISGTYTRLDFCMIN